MYSFIDMDYATFIIRNKKRLMVLWVYDKDTL